MLRKWERAFERIVEGSVASAFRLQVQPAEIGRRLERAMLDGRVTSVGTTLAPNSFVVHLHPEDAAAFADWHEALSREMESWLAELAYTRGITTVNRISVCVVPDDSVRRRAVQVSAQFAGEPEAAKAPARLTVLRLVPVRSGDRGAVLSTRTLTVGRDAGNDLVLAEPEISRHHARLDTDGGRWLVIDLESTNGTWVNGTRIRRAVIADGDELAFGPVQFTIAAG